MKKSFKYVPLSLLALGLSLSGCQDFVDGLDVNPNAPATSDALNMLQGVELGDALTHEGEAARISSMWTNQYTGSLAQYGAVNQYVVVTSDFTNLWSTIYLDVITQSRIAAARALTENNPLLSGIFQVLEAHTVGTTTSLFGDIPFRQAGDRATFPNPVYDPQRQVYTDLQRELRNAVSLLGRNGGASRDIFYQGNATKWTQAAYTLRARYYLHVQQYDSARQMALLGINTPANDWLMPHVERDGAENFYYQFQSERGDYLQAFGSQAARLLDPSRPTLPSNRNNTKTDESERFAYFFEPSQSADPDLYRLPFVIGITDPASDFPIVTYSENQLILAEAYTRAGNLTAALTALNNHRQALRTLYPTGRYDAYTLADIPGGATQTNMLREVLTEKYVTMIGQIEPFNDARRTNNLLGLALKSSTAPSLPQRFLYPQSEVNANSNTPSPVPGLFDKTPVNQ